MRLFVLAGGYGSRLSKVLKGTAKALAPVGNTPFLKIQLESWIDQGITEFTFLLHQHADQIVSFLESEKFNILKKCDVICVIENTPMGTGGAISNAIRELRFQGDFLIVNADTWLGCGFEQLSFSSPNTIAAVEVEDCSRYGALDLASGKIKRFIEKKSSCGPGLINAGLYHLSQDIFQGFSSSANFSLETDLFPSVIHRIGLSALQIETDFIDIGIPEDYFRFCKWIESGRAYEL